MSIDLPNEVPPAHLPLEPVEIGSKTHPPLGRWRRGVRETGLALITLGVIVFLFVTYQLLGTNLTEQHNQNRLQRSFDRALAQASGHPAITGPGAKDKPTVGGQGAVLVPSIPSGTAIDHLVIPKIGVDKFVVQGTEEANLTQGPGHYASTVMPGQVGNAGIAGHRTTYGAPFFRLDELKTGDPVYITATSGERYTFTVASSEVVSPSDVAVLDPTSTAQLTLTTCNPRFSATSRLVVVAKLTSTRSTPATATPTTPLGTSPAAKATPVPKPASPANTTTKAPVTNLTRGSSSALPPAVSYGAAVVALWVLARLAINRTRRWRRLGAFVVGIGVCLVPLWFLFENVVRLLPSSV